MYEEDLKEFTPNAENPTYIVLDEQGEIIGAASLIIDEYNRRGQRARFRIFHSEVEEPDIYKELPRSFKAYRRIKEDLHFYTFE